MLTWFDIDFNNLQIKEFGTWPWGLRLCILLCSVIITCSLTYFMYCETKFTALKRYKMLLIDKQHTYMLHYDRLLQLPGIKFQLQLLENLYNDNCYAPKLSNMQSFIERFNILAVDNKLQQITVNVTGTQVIDFSVKGDYQQLATFLSALLQIDAFTIEQFNLTANQLELRIKLQLDMHQTFKNSIVCKKIPSNLYHGTQSRNPFVNLAMAAVALPAGTMVGLLKNQQRSCVLIKDQLGVIHLIENA